MARFLTLLLAACLATGCASSPENDPPKAKKSKLRRFTFDDVGSNQETGGQLPGQDEATLVDGQGQERRLSEYRGRPVVLVFNRGFAGYICPYCTTYTAQIASRYDELVACGAEVVLVFPTKEDTQDQREAFAQAVDEILAEEGEEGLPFPVFLDPGLKVITEFNLLGSLSKPATFILDSQGTVRYAYVGTAPDERPSVDRIVLELQGLN